ncbi:MAG: TonB-dependent receptor plug domain-containing protein [Shewanella sp.]
MKKVLTLRPLPLLICCLFGQTAYGSDDLYDVSLEELLTTEVVGVSKSRQRINEAPANVAVITAEDIKRYGYNNIAEAISRLPGVAITRDNAYTYGGVRGMTSDSSNYNSRFLLMINGHRINDGAYDQALIGNESIIDINTIDRIEFIKGPGAVMYGGNALYGVINILTRTGRQISGAELRAAAATNEGFSGSQINGGETDSGLQWMTQVSHHEQAKRDQSNLYGEYSGRGRHNRIMGNLKGDNFTTTLLLAEHQLFDNQRTSTLPTYPQWDNGPEYIWQLNDTYQQMLLGGEYSLPLGQGTQLQVLGNMARYQNQFTTAYDYPHDGVTASTQGKMQNDWLSGELRLHSEAIAGQRWTSGVEWRRDLPSENITQQQGHGWWEYDDEFNGTYVDEDWTESSNHSLARTSLGAYVQGEFSFNDHWLLIVGGRIDKLDFYRRKFSPRLSLIWSPSSLSTLKLIYGEAFRTANAAEYSYGSMVNDYGDALKPERVESLELIYEYRQGGFSGSIAAYQNQLKDGLNHDSDLVTINGSDVTSKGLELSANYRHHSGWGGYANYSYQDISTDTTLVPMNVPNHLARAGIDGQFWNEQLTTALEWQYTADRVVYPFISEEDDIYNYPYPIAKAYHQLNLHINLKPWQAGPNVSIKALNLLDTSFAESAYSLEFPGRGREVWLGLTQAW